MKTLLKILILLVLLQYQSNAQDGRIDTLYTYDSTNVYFLLNHIDSQKIWSVELIGRQENPSKNELELKDTIVAIRHKRYKNFFLEIKGDKSYQFLIDDLNNERYYIYSDVYANPKNGIGEYIKCLYSNVEYPLKARKNNIEGIAIMMLYINNEGCLDKVEQISNLGYGIEEATKKSMESCDCNFNPSWRNDNTVNTIWLMPMKFKLE